MIDVSSEWRSFSNANGDGKEDRYRTKKGPVKLLKASGKHLMDALRSRVGAAENTLLGSSDLTTLIGPATGRWFLHTGWFF